MFYNLSIVNKSYLPITDYFEVYEFLFLLVHWSIYSNVLEGFKCFLYEKVIRLHQQLNGFLKDWRKWLFRVNFFSSKVPDFLCVLFNSRQTCMPINMYTQ